MRILETVSLVVLLASAACESAEGPRRSNASDASARPGMDASIEGDASRHDAANQPGDADGGDDAGFSDGAVPADSGWKHDAGERLDASADMDASDASDAEDGGEEDGAIAHDIDPDSIRLCQNAIPNFVTFVSLESDYNDMGQSLGQNLLPEIVCGLPERRPEGESLWTASLGRGGMIIVGFTPRVIVNGPGVDFIIFENQSPVYFPELARVAVSQDGDTWHEFPCDPSPEMPEPPGLPNYGTCAGWHTTPWEPEEDADFWTDPDQAESDQFDLDDLVGLPKNVRIRYLRITDVVDDNLSNRIFDLDAVSIVNGADD